MPDLSSPCRCRSIPAVPHLDAPNVQHHPRRPDCSGPDRAGSRLIALCRTGPVRVGHVWPDLSLSLRATSASPDRTLPDPSTLVMSVPPCRVNSSSNPLTASKFRVEKFMPLSGARRIATMLHEAGGCSRAEKLKNGPLRHGVVDQRPRPDDADRECLDHDQILRFSRDLRLELIVVSLPFSSPVLCVVHFASCS